MKKHKENLFAEKFHLLNSQESQEIIWSSSESSDFENITSNADKLSNITNKKSRKRKRKQTVPKNISNLDVTIVDVQKDAKDTSTKLEAVTAAVKPKIEDSGPKSPILGLTQYFPTFTCKDIPKSPIISSKSFENRSKVVTSPIIILKAASPKISPSARRKLFKSEKIHAQEAVGSLKSSSLVLNETFCLDQRKVINEVIHDTKLIKTKDISQRNENQNLLECNNKMETIKKELLTQKSVTTEAVQEIEITETQDSNHLINETPDIAKLDESASMLRTSSVDLAKKVKSYFDCHFSSENASQNTISEVSTPKNNSKSSEDIEIVSYPTQVVSAKQSTESINQEIDVDMNKKEKKIRYKKDGLAYRLNLLVKKQTANISLWHHEKFLAVNSNFIIPKGEFLAFRICKIHFKYGCYLLEAMDIQDDNFLIFINNCLMTSDIISTDSIVKIYEPYKILDFNSNCKYVINVVKFECVHIKK